MERQQKGLEGKDAVESKIKSAAGFLLTLVNPSNFLRHA